MVVDIPKDVQFATGIYHGPKKRSTGDVQSSYAGYRPQLKGDADAIKVAVDLIASAKKPIFYTGGGVINSGRAATQLLREFVRLTGYPITSTLMGLGAFPASDKQWLGMLGMHGTYESNQRHA